MDFSFGAAIAAGAVATVVMTAMLYMGMAVMPRQMPAPGLFVSILPWMTVMGFLRVQLVYGLVVGVLYEAWA